MRALILHAVFAVLCAAAWVVKVVVVDDFFDGSLAHAKAAHAIAGTAHTIAAMAKSVKDRLDALESQCAGSDSSGCLHGALEKAWLAAADGDILSLLILRLAVLLCRWSILRNWLIRRRRRLLLLLWHGIVLTQEAAEKARGMCGLRALRLLHLLLELRDLRPGLVEGDVLHQHRLR